MGYPTNISSIDIKSLVQNKRYAELKIQLLEKYRDATPIELILNENMEYLSARACRIISKLDEKTTKKTEKLKLDLPQIIAIGNADENSLDLILKELDRNPNMTSTKILQKVLKTRSSSDVKNLLSFDREMLRHMGIKAKAYGSITPREQHLIIDVNNRCLPKQSFQSEKQRNYFRYVLEKIHSDGVMSKPCEDLNQPCDICKKVGKILTNIFG